MSKKELISDDFIIVVKAPGGDMRSVLAKYNAFIPELEAHFKARFFFCGYDYMTNNLVDNVEGNPQLRNYYISRHNDSDRIALAYDIIDYIVDSAISFPFPTISFLDRVAQRQR